MTERRTHRDRASTPRDDMDKNDAVSTWTATPIEPLNARDQLRRVEESIDAINDVVANLAGHPPVDIDGCANSEAVTWVRRALEDVLATCTGLQISAQQDGPMRNLRVMP